MTLFFFFFILNLGDIMNKFYIIEKDNEAEIDELLVRIFDKILEEA